MLQFASSNPNPLDDHLDEMKHRELPVQEDESTVSPLLCQTGSHSPQCSAHHGHESREQPPP